MKVYTATITFDVEVNEEDGNFEMGYLAGEIEHMIQHIRNIKVPSWKLITWKQK